MNIGFHVDLALNCPKKKTPSHPSHCRLLSAMYDKRRVHALWMTECMTKRRGLIKGPRNDSRSLYLAHWRTPLESEFIVRLIMGPAWQPIAPVYLLRSRWSFIILLRGIRCLFLVAPDWLQIEACNLKRIGQTSEFSPEFWSRQKISRANYFFSNVSALF